MLARWRALPRSHETIIVGFSGGADSLALAAVLARLASFTPLRPVLVHVNHRWRDTGEAEQAAAAALARALALPFHGHRLPTDPHTRHQGVGAEEAARRERYLSLATVAAAHATDLIALAHHAEDQAETVLLHLLRGAGTQGMGGMQELRELALPYWHLPATTVVRLWRPLLLEPRSVVRDYTARLGIQPVADPSNARLDLRRNRLRAEVIPALRAIDAGAVDALGRGAALAAADSAYLDDLAADAYAALALPDGELPRTGVMAAPLPIRRRLVRLWVQQRAPWLSVTAERTDAMLACLQSAEPGRRLEIGAGVSVMRTRRGLRLAPGPAPWCHPEGEG